MYVFAIGIAFCAIRANVKEPWEVRRWSTFGVVLAVILFAWIIATMVLFPNGFQGSSQQKMIVVRATGGKEMVDLRSHISYTQPGRFRRVRDRFCPCICRKHYGAYIQQLINSRYLLFYYADKITLQTHITS